MGGNWAGILIVVDQVDQLYAIENEIRGRSPDER